MNKQHARVFVGNLTRGITSAEVRGIFTAYGRVDRVNLKNPNRPFGFVDFKTTAEAAEAVQHTNGLQYWGRKLRVEIVRPEVQKTGQTELTNGASANESEKTIFSSPCRVYVYDLPKSASWQDLKHHMRRRGRDVEFCDVYYDGSGVVDFYREADAVFAANYINGSKFRSRSGEVHIIEVIRPVAP